MLSAGRLVEIVRKDGISSSDAVCKSVCAVPQKLLRKCRVSQVPVWSVSVADLSHIQDF